MLKIQNFTKMYDDKAAVDNLSLEVGAGDIYAFIGHNGAGKTTTIKACCGILQFEQGEIFINGMSVKENPLGCKKQIAYIPDNPELYEYLSGIKYLNFVADIYGVGKNERNERIAKYADAFLRHSGRGRVESGKGCLTLVAQILTVGCGHRILHPVYICIVVLAPLFLEFLFARICLTAVG